MDLGQQHSACWQTGDKMAEKWTECLAKIDAATGLHLTDEEKDAMLSKILAAKRQIKAARGVADDAAFAAAAAEAADREKMAAAIQRATTIRNAAARQAITSRIDVGSIGKDAAQKLESIVAWTAKGDNAQNMQALSRDTLNRDLASVAFKIRKLGSDVYSSFRRGEMDKAIFDARYKLSVGDKIGDTPAEKVAQILHDGEEAQRQLLNSAGAYIGQGEKRAGKMSWDSSAMRRGGFGGDPKVPVAEARAAFVKDMKSRLDWDAMAERARQDVDQSAAMDVQEDKEAWQDRLLTSAWNAMVTGERKPQPGAPSIWGGQMEGGLNIAKRVSESRLFVFKDGASQIEMMRKYGAARTAFEQYIMSASGAAKQHAIMRFAGPNPEYNIDRVVGEMKLKYRDTDPDGLKAFEEKLNSRGGFNQQFQRFTGALNIPVNERWTELFHGVRAYYDTTMLGGVGLTHAMSLPATLGSAIRSIGGSRLEGLSDLVKALLTGRSAAEHSEAAAELGIYSGAVTRPAKTEWSQMDIPGRVSWLHGKFLDATGVHYFLDNAQRAMRELSAHTLARENSRLEWGENAHLTKVMSRYGFDPDQWAMLKGIERTTSDDGCAYLTPHDVATKTAPAAVEQYLRGRGQIAADATPETIQAAVDGWRQDFGQRLGMMYQDLSDQSTVTAGIRESAILRGTQRPGESFASELMSTFTMFKSWPVAAFHQMIMRDIYQSLDKRDMAGAIFGIVAASMFGGYLRMAGRAFADGKPVPDPTDPATIFGALAQGGGLGILGDIAFGETNRAGGDPLSALAGPVAGDISALMKAANVSELLKGWSHYKQQQDAGKIEDVWPALAMWAEHHVPGNNLIYLKGAIDYMAWYHILDTLKPGWWERANQRSIKERGSPLAGYQPGAGVPYGVPPFVR